MFLSRILDAIVARKLSHFLHDSKLIEVFQSGFRDDQITETALLKVRKELPMTSDSGLPSVRLFVPLDLSVALDLRIHLRRLEDVFGIKEQALNWMRSFD